MIYTIYTYICVRIASPNSATAAGDAAQAAFDRKLSHYSDIIPQLRQAGVAFRPMVWTADGRPHPAAVRAMRLAAERAARGDVAGAKPAAFLMRWQHEVAITIARRRAAMARAVMPQQETWQQWLMHGRGDNGPGWARRQPCLEGELRDAAASPEERPGEEEPAHGT